ncbi:MAG: NuoI/complex I 23 kDa subunit family protein [Dissulfurispiraceae bacterium]
MIKLRELARKVFFIDIIRGLSLTIGKISDKPVTRRYPEEKRKLPVGFRGLHALTRNPATGEARCVGCGLCAAICPSECIHIYTSDGPDNAKIVDRYEIEVLRCVYCGFCVEACPFSAVVLTEHYEYADISRQALYMNKERLLTNFDSYMGHEKEGAYFKLFWHPRKADFSTSPFQAKLGGAGKRLP